MFASASLAIGLAQPRRRNLTFARDRAPYHLRDVGGAGDWATRYKDPDEADNDPSEEFHPRALTAARTTLSSYPLPMLSCCHGTDPCAKWGRARSACSSSPTSSCGPGLAGPELEAEKVEVERRRSSPPRSSRILARADCVSSGCSTSLHFVNRTASAAPRPAPPPRSCSRT